MLATKRIIILDIMRVIAVGLIIAVHIAQKLGSPLGGFFGIEGFYYVTWGGIGVTLFLILSGMAIELSYAKKKVDFREFMLKRIQRIYPIYWMTLIFAILITLYLGNPLGFTWKNYLFNATGLQGLSGMHWETIFISPVTWFIGLIMALYLLYPFVSKMMDKQKNFILLAILIISIFSRWYVGKYWLSVHRPIDWFPLCRLFEFSLGLWLIKTERVYNFIQSLSLSIFNKPVTFLAVISFPAFLIHFPLLKLFPLQNSWEIPLFLITTIFLAWLILLLDNKIQKNISLTSLFSSSEAPKST
ncbi:MAG: acyltransferase family protein [bacterium]|nr:acyltransferase family protein [bacterium]